MAHTTAEEFAQNTFDLGLISEHDLSALWAHFGSKNVPLEDFVQQALRREFLTNYQIERLNKGDRTGYFFGKYKVLYCVGAGTFARVYRAVEQDTGSVVAVKVLRKRYSDNPSQYGLFVREGQLGCKLEHPNIVRIFSVSSEKRVHFLVMEFVEGQTLKDFVRIRGRLSPEEATNLTIDIVSGLRYAFEYGLTHRDLKLNNVLVSSQGRAKLVDFGLAAIGDDLGDESADLAGARTVDYAGLERASGVRKDDTRSDLYFVGTMFYHMVVGQAPLKESRDRLQRLSRQRFVDVTPIQKAMPDVPHSLAIVVNKSMQLDPEKRYQAPAEMLADLAIAKKRLGEELEHGRTAANMEIGDGQGLAPTVKHSVMVVESSSKMQDTFRTALKKSGYRVLVTVDPERALARVRDDSDTADCVILNAQSLGAAAVHTFNEFGSDSRTDAVPVILLLDERQKAWAAKAETAPLRVILQMPITMKQLRSTIAKVIEQGEISSSA